MKYIVIGTATLLCIAAVLFVTTRHGHENSEHSEHSEHQHQVLPPAEIGDASIYQLESMWLNQEGQTQTLADLAGKPTVAAMIYTSCEFACPLIVRDMFAIYNSLDADERTSANFVLFSFDPQRDTPQAMRHYAAEQNLPAADWTLLAADDYATLELAVALGVRYKPLTGGDFAHSNVVFVLDCGGTPSHRQEGLGIAPEDAATAVRDALQQCSEAS